MTDEQMRVKVALRLGWRQIINADGDLTEGHLTRTWTEWIGPNDEQSTDYMPPDFPNDLNACAEMALGLDASQSMSFLEHLESIVKRDCSSDEGRWWKFHLVNATARQRCAAFLRVYGDWEDGSGSQT